MKALRGKKSLVFLIVSVLCLCMGAAATGMLSHKNNTAINDVRTFDASIPAIRKAMTVPLRSEDSGVRTDLLALTAAQYGGDFSEYRDEDLQKLASDLNSGKSIKLIAADIKDFEAYSTLYHRVLDGIAGGKGYFPVADGFYCEHYSDFGDERTYGGKRQHLGHDIFCSEGTPVIAVEDGTVEALGWNEYGGWRIGIRSTDGQRYLYYAHLRKDRPYRSGLREGMKVSAGDVIGYVGKTGYSKEENTEGISVPHLHFGIMLTDEKCGELWVDTYSVVGYLEEKKQTVRRSTVTGDFSPAGLS